MRKFNYFNILNSFCTIHRIKKYTSCTLEHYDYTIIFNDYMLVILHIEIIESI